MWFWWLRFSAICNRRFALIWTIVEFFILVEMNDLRSTIVNISSSLIELPQLSTPLWLPQEWYHAVLWDHGAKPSIYATGMQLNAYVWHLMHGTAQLCVHVIVYLGMHDAMHESKPLLVCPFKFCQYLWCSLRSMDQAQALYDSGMAYIDAHIIPYQTCSHVVLATSCHLMF